MWSENGHLEGQNKDKRSSALKIILDFQEKKEVHSTYVKLYDERRTSNIERPTFNFE